MSNSDQADSEFQKFIKTFRDAFGIQREEDVQTEQRKILSQSIRIDAIVVFPNDFDFTTLRDRIFPFLSMYTILEYKGQRDPLLAGHFYLYSFAELGLMTARFLSKERTDRKGWNYLSQRAVSQLSQRLKEQGAAHFCCTVILSTTDPRQLRKTVGFEAVTDYSHLDGALYRLVISENKLIGSIATYLVVLNDLPVCEKNAPLLLLTTGKKKIEFCRWLQSDTPGMVLEEKRHYQLYLLKHGLIKDEETEREMRKTLFTQSDANWIFDQFEPNYNWIFEALDQRSEDHQAQFRQLFYEKMLDAHSPQEVAQKALGASSPQEVAQKALGASSPQEVAQKALYADSPVDAALKLLQTSSEGRELLKRLKEEENVPAS